MSATHQMIDGLERLRQAAIGGDLTAGNRALTVVDHLEKKSTMPRSTVRAARCLALEAQGWSLRNAANMMLVRAQAVAELFGVTVERERLAATLTERLDEWKRACDALVDECLARGEGDVPSRVETRWRSRWRSLRGLRSRCKRNERISEA